MTKETSAEYRRGFQDAVLIIESSLQMAAESSTEADSHGLERAMNIIANTKPPQFIR